MSVQVIEPKIFSYIMSGLEKAAYNTVMDDFYIEPIRQHCKSLDIETECLRLVRSFSDMNNKSYAGKYKEEFTSDAAFIVPTLTHKALTAVQLLKYLQATRYNIEREHWTLSVQEKADYKLLADSIFYLMQSILHNTEEWKQANWND